MTQQAKLQAMDLAHFTGSEQFYRHPIFRKVVYTEGVQYLAEKAGAYWLVDAIASHLALMGGERPGQSLAEASDGMLFWKLEKRPDSSCTLSARKDCGLPALVEQEIEYTDFPLDFVEIWTGFDGSYWTLYLPSEH
jgi:hypothetical protein